MIVNKGNYNKLVYLKIIGSLPNNIAEQKNLIIDKSRPEDRYTFLPIFLWVCL